MKWLKELKSFIPVVIKYNMGAGYYTNSRKLKFTFNIDIFTYNIGDDELFKSRPDFKVGLSEKFLNKKILHIKLRVNKSGYDIYIGGYKIYRFYHYRDENLKKQIKNLPTW